MNIVLFGPPGAGKSSFSRLLTKHLLLNHISTGDIFRDHLARLTPLGRQVKGYLDVGALCPDDLTIQLMTDKIRDVGSNLLLDGFPRTLIQAVALDHLVKVDAVVNIVSKDEELISRLLNRGRADDTEDVIRKRLEVYKAQSEPCLEYYKERVLGIDGTGSIEEVFERIKGALK